MQSARRSRNAAERGVGSHALRSRFARSPGANVAARSNEAGVALVYSILGAFTAASLVTVLLSVSMASNRMSGAQRHAAQAQYLAEGALEAAKKEVQTAIANRRAVPRQGVTLIDARQIEWNVRPTGFSRTEVDPAGITTSILGFELSASARVHAQEAQAYRVVNVESTPLLQFAAFANGDLELQSRDSMTWRGRIHSNGAMYLGSDHLLTLDTNHVRAVGGIYRHRKDDPSRSSGTVRVRKWVANPFDAAEPREFARLHSRSQLAFLGVSSTSGYDSNFQSGHDADLDGSWYGEHDFLPFVLGLSQYWSEPDVYLGGQGQTIAGSNEGVGEAVVPDVASIAMFEERAGGDWYFDVDTGAYLAAAPGMGTHQKGYYHGHAGLSVLVAADGASFKVYGADGVELPADLSSAITLSALYDARQSGGAPSTTTVLDIDLAALRESGHFPANGLLYAAHHGAGTGAQASGVRIKNGAVLQAPLSIVSENPIYVQGDFNVGDATYPKVGACAIGDAVNLLSNAWDDTKAHGGPLPTADDTTFNLAIVSGNVETQVGAYNGGLENLPRLHENWSGRTCALDGALVSAWPSRYATAPWVYGSGHYEAPTRAWNYDEAFNTVASLPPFTPLAVSARDVVSW